MIFVNLGDPKYGFRRVFMLFVDSIWKIVHKISIFDGMEIVAISIIMVRFWWSFFCFSCDNQSYQNLARNNIAGSYEISIVPPTKEQGCSCGEMALN